MQSRRISIAIMSVIPIAFLAWALTIAVPTAYETWRASEEIFQPRVDREGFADDAPPAPTAMPESVRALLTATAEGSAPARSGSQIPIVGPDDESPSPTLGTITHPDVTSDDPTAIRREATGVPAPPAATATPLPEWNGSDPIHILLLGVDTRPSETSEGRSDTMIVVRIDPVVKRVDMFSIPRDLAVNIPGFANGVKVNSAYSWGFSYGIEGGGPALVAQTIELNFGIVIDYYATVDIPGLEHIVNTLGGVIIDVDVQLTDDQYPTEDFGYTRAYFPSGLQELDGVQAVQYARTRHADGDFRRSERQHQLLIAIRDRFLEAGLITRLPDLIGDLRDSVRTDLTPRQVFSLASLAQDIEREDIWIHALTPYTVVSETEQGWFLIGDWDALRWVVQNLHQDPLATNIPGS
ncbi:LCP family protein [soil metagenome]